MKPSSIHIIKSVRIANARMGRPVEETPFAPSGQKEKRNLSARHPRSRSRNQLPAKNEGSHSTEHSDIRRPGKGRRGRRPLAKPSSVTTQATVKESIVPAPEIPFFSSENGNISLKRVKQPRVLRIIEDGRPWTDHEMEMFENLYGERLFDNSIDTGPATQVDMAVLKRRRFKSYRADAQTSHISKAIKERGEIFGVARKLLQYHGLVSVTDSQLLRMLQYFSNGKSFLDFLRLEPEVLISYFEKTKPASRRRCPK